MIGGRLDKNHPAPDALDKADLREAYERGRRDARAGRRRHPVLMTFTVIAAVIGVVLLVLAAVNGSFGQGGGVVDQNLRVAADRAQPAMRDAASGADQSLRQAGQSIRGKSADSAG